MSETALAAKSPFEMRVHLGDGMSETDVQSALDSGDMGFLHSFTTGSTVDGPGVRVVIWTTGCGWRCRYCHNPDTWLKILAGAKAMGVHTTIETNGFFGEKLTDADLASIDLVMLGLKTWDPKRHRELTGREIGPTLDFSRRLAAANRPMWVRFVLVPGLTDDLHDIGQIAKHAAALGNVARVEVLPFHQLGRFKWKELGIEYKLEKTEAPTQALVDEAIEVFRDAGLEAY